MKLPNEGGRLLRREVGRTERLVVAEAGVVDQEPTRIERPDAVDQGVNPFAFKAGFMEGGVVAVPHKVRSRDGEGRVPVIEVDEV